RTDAEGDLQYAPEAAAARLRLARHRRRTSSRASRKASACQRDLRRACQPGLRSHGFAPQYRMTNRVICDGVCRRSKEERMRAEVRVRPWHLALVSLTGGAVGALVFAAFTPSRTESEIDGLLPSFAPLAQQVMPAVVNINTTKNIPARTQRRQM